MDHNDTTAANSVITVSDVSCLSRPPIGFHILEITLVSAQDLPPVSKSLRTYAIVWTNPNRKRTTSIDQNGHTNPTWNDKFSFKVDDDFLASDKSTVTVEIYTVSWFRDVLVGTVSVNVGNLISPSEKGKRMVSLQIRRPSGSPQGMLNLAAALLESTSRSMPLSDLMSSSSGYKKDLELERRNILGYENGEDEERQRLHAKIQQWRRSMSADVMSDLNCEEFPGKPGSVCNGSMVNGGSVVNYGSEVCSDVGPSASVVAAEIAKSWQQSAAPRKETMERGLGDSMVLPANFTADEEKKREEAAADDGENEEMEMIPKNGGHGRRKSDSAYSCFVYGFQFTIVCGATNNPSKTKKKKSGKNSD